MLETEHGFLITSPLLTAFIMSRHLTDLQLLFVLAEMCGLFAVCALPAALEVEAYLLLALPRSLGGEGFCDIELNVEVMLGTSARAIVGKSRVYIDLLLSSPDGRRQVAIECQGKASHGRAGDGLRDADRMTALQAMGYDVLLLTYRQISDEDRFRAIVKAVCRMLDAEYRDKSSDEQRAEALLRSELFVDWTKLGVIDGKMPARHKMARSWTAAVLSE